MEEKIVGIAMPANIESLVDIMLENAKNEVKDGISLSDTLGRKLLKLQCTVPDEKTAHEIFKGSNDFLTNSIFKLVSQIEDIRNIKPWINDNNKKITDLSNRIIKIAEKEIDKDYPGISDNYIMLVWSIILNVIFDSLYHTTVKTIEEVIEKEHEIMEKEECASSERTFEEEIIYIHENFKGPALEEKLAEAIEKYKK